MYWGSSPLKISRAVLKLCMPHDWHSDAVGARRERRVAGERGGIRTQQSSTHDTCSQAAAKTNKRVGCASAEQFLLIALILELDLLRSKRPILPRAPQSFLR